MSSSSVEQLLDDLTEILQGLPPPEQCTPEVLKLRKVAEAMLAELTDGPAADTGIVASKQRRLM